MFYMEHLPFVTQLMVGEVFCFDGPEGYWMTNLAGLPFGIDNQFYPVPSPATRSGRWSVPRNPPRSLILLQIQGRQVHAEAICDIV